MATTRFSKAPAGRATDVDALAEHIDAWLPQTQCTRCGYPCCGDYAQAVARREVDVNRCPPGGETTLRALARLTGSRAAALDSECGTPTPRTVALIDESRCIGCTLCIQACPVDAIVGAAKLMHTVIAAQCTGCELCLPPCPVDCIDLLAATPPAATGPWPLYDAAEAENWRRRTTARITRESRRPRERRDSGRGRPVGIADAAVHEKERERIRRELEAAVERARLRRAARSPLAPASRSAHRGRRD